MKKIIALIFFLIIICFVIPIFFTKSFNEKEVIALKEENNQENTVNENTNKEYDYKQYNTIKVLHTKTNQIEEMNLDIYLLRCCFSRNAG